MSWTTDQLIGYAEEGFVTETIIDASIANQDRVYKWERRDQRRADYARGRRGWVDKRGIEVFYSASDTIVDKLYVGSAEAALVGVYQVARAIEGDVVSKGRRTGNGNGHV